MPTYTPNYNFVLPIVNSSVDEDLWGTYLNTDMTSVDPLIRTAITNEISAKTTSFTATANISSRYFYVCDASGGAIVATLPAASSAPSGCTISLKKVDSSTNAVTPTPSGSDTTDASALSNQFQSVTLVSDGVSKWNVLSEGKLASIPDASTSTKGIIQIATDAEALAGTDALKALTSAALASSKSLGTNGYYVFPGGFTIQWGTATAGGNPQTINLPRTFTTAYSGFAINATGNSIYCSVSSITTTQLTVNKTNTTGGGTNLAFYWFAFGVS